MLLTARQYREGLEQGRAEGLEQAQDWHNLSESALEKGESFDEPPPSAGQLEKLTTDY